MLLRSLRPLGLFIQDVVCAPKLNFISTRFASMASTSSPKNGYTKPFMTACGKNSKPVIICVEGNIGSGKTTFLQHFEKNPDVEVMMEPVHRWQNIQGQNALELMYQDPSRWSMTLQTYVQLTMTQLHMQPMVKPIKMMERSIYSARYCFVEAQHNGMNMADIDYVILNEWFKWIIGSQDVKVDRIVYLQTRPETVFERIRRRCRKEETTIPLEYLQTLHDLHEDWLIHKKFPCPFPVEVIDANQDLETLFKVYEDKEQTLLYN